MHGDCVFDRLEAQVRAQAVRDAPTENAASGPAQDHDEVDEAPEPSRCTRCRPVDDQAPKQVPEHQMGRVSRSGVGKASAASMPIRRINVTTCGRPTRWPSWASRSRSIRLPTEVSSRHNWSIRRISSRSPADLGYRLAVHRRQGRTKHVGLPSHGKFMVPADHRAPPGLFDNMQPSANRARPRSSARTSRRIRPNCSSASG